MCRWDWVDDSYEGVREHKKKVRSRLIALEASKSNNGLDGDDTEMDDSANVASAAAVSAAATTTSAVSKSCCNMKDNQEEDVKMAASNEDSNDRAMDDSDDNHDEDEGMEEDEYDEDYEDEDDESEESGEDEWGHPIGSFRSNIYDDYGSTSAQEEREIARLHEETEANRMRIHLLQEQIKGLMMRLH